MFSRMGAAAIKKDLGNIRALCEVLNQPQSKLKCIHIAGSNGKGSTSHMLAAIFQQAGYKTGLYTSPHLADFRERIRINGRMIPKSFVTDFVALHRLDIERIEPSFFEITVGMAFAAFADAEVDIAIIETGLGGRLDSTNVILPELSIITNISLEHTDILGKTLAAIAGEKAGIIKAHTPVLIGEDDPETMPVFLAKAKTEHAPLYRAAEHWHLKEDGNYYRAQHSGQGTVFQISCPLKGSYQLANIRTVLAATELMRGLGWTLTDTALLQGLASVSSLTGLRGRWDCWQEQPLILADVAHNPAGLNIVFRDWEKIRAKNKHILLGFVRDKDVRGALALFPKDENVHFCAAQVPRALPASELAQIASEQGLNGNVFSSVADALSELRNSLQPEDALLITGSFFIVGEAMVAFGLTEE
ncbi:MAG: bifunctional folylpolyglutamate synthase/dihydrofolate synthase [Bacteroidetes bacterium]|nr:bifunctional folylpolyglutamate synthase/dihydrofolate synthase [Bacteroidota bacterium]MBS1630011.1 bifunctional folylpolyglutamate synthase/dihydrofolate synthase [Bacteroidota bacterium]